ncbi:hypothetical protein [Leptospira bandrabouensis]|uniref:hypothetical protein n=1 Tax=Leptospira bandrabouensis TaxID=2484903 RepID=UPI001EEA4FD8|nr:hypothetical protein [Leptospira bandrabouensis]MCG6152609.1 hypothetical protein [Leptospira bandrabouensis]
MNPNQKIVNSKVEELIAQGGYVKEYKSIWKLSVDDRDFRFFANQEHESVKHLTVYNKNGSNPAESKEATIVAFGFELTGDNEVQIDLSAPSGSYARLASATKFLNQLQYKFKQNTNNLREGFVSKIHQPIPRILKPLVIGTGIANHIASVAVGDVAGNNIEHKNEKHALYLPVELVGNNDVLDTSVFIPSNGYKVDSDLAGCYLILHALGVEFPKGRKLPVQSPPKK